MSKTFHFTIGPVQGFVAQARRTRDFWAGSFILSWLAGVAMAAVRQQAGDKAIRFPAPDEPFMAALEGKVKVGDEPRQGTVPNRFMAEVGEEFDPAVIPETVGAAWRALADRVWEGDELGQLAGPETLVIWERQVSAFWEMSWALTEGNDPAVLDRRKNWRSHCPPPEPGTKCHVMEGWQELSGAERPGEQGKPFWAELRTSQASGIATDLREGERLCAPAYIKRRLTRHFGSLDAEMPGGWRLRGWRLSHSVPSVAYMAAAHWLAGTIAKAEAPAMWRFHNLARELTGSYGERDSHLPKVREAIQSRSDSHEWKWDSLDGDVLFEESLKNKNAFPETDQADKARQALADLKRSAGTGHPTPFYALLLMDGDSLGVHMSDSGKQPDITEGLRVFTKDVPGIVERHNGFTIYAGGDDVLALLPLEDALPCAVALRQKYLDAFQDYPEIPTTLSGAVVFAHVRTPLTQVNGEAHPLLDDLAKDARGRDSLAIQVRKPSGVAATWAMPWEVALDGEGENVRLQQLADQLGDEDGEAPFAGRFFYHLRSRYDLLNPAGQEDGGDAATKALFDQDKAQDLLAAEYVTAAQAAGKPVGLERARKVVGGLIGQCRPQTRLTDDNGHKTDCVQESRLEPDGALIVRFLAQKGAEA